ncbi:MAG: DUF4258 domain-containing protein [Gammaproteobacteria bacterium]|nr:DUF4258 domain-containing protein [Gammaproteobacteria bacterium]
MNAEDNVIKLNLTERKALEIVRDIAEHNTARVATTNHAKQRMRERGITRLDILRCLMHGKIIEGPYRSARGNWEFKMCSLESGERVQVVAALENDGNGNLVIIITTF